MKPTYFIPIIILNAIIIVACLVFSTALYGNGIAAMVVLFGNLILFCITALSTFFIIKALTATRTVSFMQMSYGSIFCKLVLCAVSIFIYIKNANPVNKPAVYILMVLYLLYATLETRTITQVTKHIKNAKGKATN